MRILGIDPGCYGALALLVNGALDAVHDMPFLKVRRGKSDKAEIDGYTLGSLLSALAPDIVVIEQVGGIKGQAAGSSFNFGRAAGAPEYAAKTLRYRVEMIPPATWKRALRLNPGKDGAFAAASKMWPEMAHRWAAVRGNGNFDQRSGRAEAPLIAHYGQITYGGSNVFD